MDNLSQLNQNFGLSFNNFDPENIQNDSTINAVFIVDVSPSVEDYEAELNNAFNEFVQRMQKSHIADSLFVSTLEFNETVMVKTGFQPIINVPVMKFVPRGRATALYDAVQSGLKNALEYRTQLEDSGINTKTLVFIITDGEDNNSRPGSANEVKNLIQDFLKNEKNTFSFTSILFGVGNQANFESAQKDMGIQHLAKVGNTADEIRKMINFISSSISTTSSGQAITNVTF